MGLYEMLQAKIDEGQKKVKEGHYVELEILNRSNRYFIRNPILIQEKDGIYVTNKNGYGGYFNLKYCTEIFVKIRLPNRWVDVSNY